MFEELDEPWQAARTRWFLGEALWRSGVYQEAEALCRQSLAEFEGMGDRLFSGYVQESLGLLTKHLGRLDEAERLQLASLEIFRELGDRYREAGALFSLSVTRHEQGRLAEGLQLAEDADFLYQELGDVKMQGAAKNSKAQILTFLGRYQEAHQALTEAGSLIPNDKTGYIPMSTGLLALAEGKFAAAQENLALAVACNQTRNLSRSIGITLVYLTIASIKIGDLSEARTQLKDALQLGVKTRAAMPIWEGLAAASLLAVVEGRSEQAVVLFARSTQEPIIGRSHYFAKVVGEQITACEASLQPDEVERLKGQGRAMDMWETAASLLAELSEQD